MTDAAGSAAPAHLAHNLKYTDAAAMNDIQALLTSQDQPSGKETTDAITEILERTGRFLITPRVISSNSGTDQDQLPYAFISVEDMCCVRVEQDPCTGEVRVVIWSETEAEDPEIVIELNAADLRLKGGPTGLSTAPPARARQGDRTPLAEEDDHEPR